MKEIKPDQQYFNKLAQECSAHRMVQTSFESVYATKGDYGDPIVDQYTYKCNGSCGQSYTVTIKN